MPLGRVVISSKVRLEFPRHDFEGGRFTDTVGTDETEDLAGTRCGESVEFESVGGVSMGNVRFKVSGKVKNLNGVEGTPVTVSADS